MEDNKTDKVGMAKAEIKERKKEKKRKEGRV